MCPASSLRGAGHFSRWVERDAEGASLPALTSGTEDAPQAGFRQVPGEPAAALPVNEPIG